MKYDPDNHRRSIRLKGYDYSQSGAYFVTICTQNRECLFGDISDGEMRLNYAGQMVRDVWNDLPIKYRGVEIDEFVVMPNHVHGIIVIVGAPLVGAHSSGTVNHDIENRAGTRPAPTGESETGQPRRVAPTLGDVIGSFKSITTHQDTDGVRQHNWLAFNSKLWQRNYYEHIIRDEEEIDRIRQYIIDNPGKWAEDDDNPETLFAGAVRKPPLWLSIAI